VAKPIAGVVIERTVAILQSSSSISVGNAKFHAMIWKQPNAVDMTASNGIATWDIVILDSVDRFHVLFFFLVHENTHKAIVMSLKLEVCLFTLSLHCNWDTHSLGLVPIKGVGAHCANGESQCQGFQLRKWQTTSSSNNK
jgi:hypothetical protein